MIHKPQQLKKFRSGLHNILSGKCPQLKVFNVAEDLGFVILVYVIADSSHSPQVSKGTV
jgi:hypothetical protein